ncbi:MAG: malectin domain-containing carbohydrate-binding protein [Candidatus Acidiferrales bacterium]
MCAIKSIQIGVCLLAGVVAILPGASSSSAQSASAIRYVFGTNPFTDSKGQLWSPVPHAALSGSASYHWSICTPTAVFTGTPDPGLYRQQIVEDSGDMLLTVPVPSGSYVVNLYFAEPCANTLPGSRVFGVAVNGSMIASSLDLTATAAVEKPVTESAQTSGSLVSLDLKRITDAPVIAAIEILPASTSASSPSTTSPSFAVTAKLTWDDRTPVAGTVVVTQLVSTGSTATKSLGSFLLNAKGTVTASLTPDLTLPLTFSFTLVSPTGATVNTLTFSADLVTIKVFPRTLNASIVLTKSNATLKSFSF